MKKFFMVLISVALLVTFTGCFGSGDNTSVSEDITSKIYENSNFSIKLPKDWVAVERNDMRSDIPAEIEVMFLNNIKDPFYTASVVIARQSLDTEYSSLDFGKLMMQKHKDTIYDFTELQRTPFTFEDGTESLIFEFEGRESLDSDLIVVKELYYVSGKTAYTVTAGHSQHEDEGVTIDLDEIIKSFSVK